MSSKLWLTTVAAAVALAAPPVAAAAPSTYTDPTGDNGTSADIGGVTVDRGADGYIRINVTISNLPGAGSEGSLVLGFDVDRNGSTGALWGADYAILVFLDGPRGAFLEWNGSDYEPLVVQEGHVRYATSGSGAEFVVHPAALGDARQFNFVVGAASGAPDSGQIDVAPDTGTWLFEAAQGGVDGIQVRFAPSAPRAGAAFRPSAVRLRMSDGTGAVTGSYRCVARLAGRLLRGGGRGGCTFRIPKTARGKRLSITVFVTRGGTVHEFEPYVFRVR